MPMDKFGVLVGDLLKRLDSAFTELRAINDPGKITVTRVSPVELQIKVAKTGTYRVYCDSAASDSQYLYLQSPLSGIYNYKYDEGNQQWKSETQVHIIEELLMREFITFTKGTLNL